MNKIGSKIQSALTGSILIVCALAIALLLVNQLNAFQNQQIIQTMAMEYSIIPLSEELIKTYNNVVKNPGNAQFTNEYKNTHEKITSVISILKTKIEAQESRILLLGVESTVNQVLDDCDTGLSEVAVGNFQNFSAHFAQAHKNNDFVLENTNDLLKKELGYLSQSQDKSMKSFNNVFIASLGIMLFMVFFMIYYAYSFSKQLILPIEQLTDDTKKFASGNMDIVISQSLLKQKDEVGVLSNSFQLLITTLKNKMKVLQDKNGEIETSKKELEKGNEELKKLNSFMVDRELKMIELKEKIAKLEKTSTLTDTGK